MVSPILRAHCIDTNMSQSIFLKSKDEIYITLTQAD